MKTVVVVTVLSKALYTKPAQNYRKRPNGTARWWLQPRRRILGGILSCQGFALHPPKALLGGSWVVVSGYISHLIRVISTGYPTCNYP